MLIISPIIYVMIGLLLARMPYDVKGPASSFLAKVVIPIVIVFNIATNRPGVLLMALGMIVIMGIMLLISRNFSVDPIQNLCFCYLNIGWLGLPIASTIFGDKAAVLIISAYIGSSIFGNSVGVGLMMFDAGLRLSIVQFLKTPPIFAIIIGSVCIPFKTIIENNCMPIYAFSKFLMGLLGMTILGIWLSNTQFNIENFKSALIQFLIRSFSMFLLFSLFIFICIHCNVDFVAENKTALYLVCLLPPAANIIALETHYLKSGRSASIIACGTFISIISIFLYIYIIVKMHPNNIVFLTYFNVVFNI